MDSDPCAKCCGFIQPSEPLTFHVNTNYQPDNLHSYSNRSLQIVFILLFCFVLFCYLHLNFSRSLTLPTAGTICSVRSERFTRTDTCSLSKQVCLQNKSIAPPFKSTHIDRGVQKSLKTALCWRYSKIRLKLNKRAKRCEARLYLWFYFENIKGSLVSV